MYLNPTPDDVVIRKLGDTTLNSSLAQNTNDLSKPFLNKLIHAAGHDMRSPLFVIRSYSQLLQRTQERERIEKGFKLIAEATVTMEATLSSFVQLMDIYTLPVPKSEHLGFNEIFEKVKVQLYNEIKQHQPQFIVDFKACPEVVFSSDFLMEIMFNLIDNSIRHNPEKEDLVIKIETLTNYERTVLQISDNGKGIKDLKEIEKIKQPFYSITNDVNSSGIGLSKIQAIAQVSESYFEIESPTGFGMICKFIF